jgi:hypothetical protein
LALPDKNRLPLQIYHKKYAEIKSMSVSMFMDMNKDKNREIDMHIDMGHEHRH